MPLTEARTEPIEKQLDPRGPIASRGGSAPVLLKKPIATCDFPRGDVRIASPPPTGSAHGRHTNKIKPNKSGNSW